MSTIKTVIINKYLEFQNKLKQIVDIDIFPSLEDIDIVDLLLFFNMTFGGSTEYENVIKDIIFFHNFNIDNDKLANAMPVITQFIDEFKLLQKSF